MHGIAAIATSIVVLYLNTRSCTTHYYLSFDIIISNASLLDTHTHSSTLSLPQRWSGEAEHAHH
jgi:hypothetical protein